MKNRPKAAREVDRNLVNIRDLSVQSTTGAAAQAENQCQVQERRQEQGKTQAIVRDGVGATKFVTVEVNGGGNHQECLDVEESSTRILQGKVL